jgi:aryl-alcohol dehydrogenase-like predicted oxidoreductase
LEIKKENMLYNKIGKTDLEVSQLCMGSMTWGEQNTEAEGHEQLDYAFSQGINFIDTAEMYSVPGRAETQGSTESIIGTWLEKNKNRKDLTLATKVTGPNPGLSYIRKGPNFKRESILTAIEGSLSRLKTDYIDIYQLHWPERNTNFFGKLNYKHNADEEWGDNIAEVIETMNNLVKEGKIRYYGLSNETPWGLMHYLKTAENLNLDKCVTVQNPYSLLNRTYEVGLAEVSMREGGKLLAYSPLAFGVLSGKYLNGQKPADGRITLFPQFSRYSDENTLKAVAAYKEVAEKHGLDLVKMSLAFIRQQPFVASTIIGATKMTQLKQNIDSVNVTLSEDVLKDLETVHEIFPFPAP